MTLVNIGIAGCLGRMGRELAKSLVEDKRVNFSGGFEYLDHKDLNKKFSSLLGLETDHKVSDNPEKIFSDSDVGFKCGAKEQSCTHFEKELPYSCEKILIHRGFKSTAD